jgi:hypothetical protein
VLFSIISSISGKKSIPVIISRESNAHVLPLRGLRGLIMNFIMGDKPRPLFLKHAIFMISIDLTKMNNKNLVTVTGVLLNKLLFQKGLF